MKTKNKMRCKMRDQWEVFCDHETEPQRCGLCGKMGEPGTSCECEADAVDDDEDCTDLEERLERTFERADKGAADES